MDRTSVDVSAVHVRTFKECDRAEAAVVFIHGFMGSPLQFADLADAVYTKGFSCLSVLLPGHGAGAREFARYGATHWESKVQCEMDELRARFRRIYLVGHSVGGLLALQACLVPENRVAGVMLLCTPLRFNFPNPIPYLRNMGAAALPKNKDIRRAYRDANSIAKSNPLLYPLVLKTALSVFKLVKMTESRLARVRIPVVLFHSKSDETTSFQSAALLYEGLRNAPRIAFALQRSWHAFFYEDERDMIKEKLLEMLGEPRV